MAFDLFGSPTTCDIRVGYISTETGFVDGISVYEANKYAKVNPGTQFVFRNREKVEYLNINEVNKLKPEDMLPEKRSGNKSCGNIVGLNPQGDTTQDISETIGDLPAIVGGSSEELKLLGGKFEKDSVRVNFYGGGGVGVQGNPVIGSDGSLLDVDLIHGGFGYQYPPIVDIEDDKGVGSGAVVRALVGGGSSVIIDEFDREEDFEEYDLVKCAPALEKVGFGDRYGNDGKVLGAWDPSSYLGKKKDPLRAQIDKYQDILSKLKKDQRYDRKTDRILNWWTTRYEAPLAVTSPNKTSREKFDVQHYAWGGKRTVTALEQESPPPTPSNFKEVSFLVYTQGGHDRGLAFNFIAKDGSHKFSIKADKYRDGAVAVEEKIKIKVNTLYKVVSTGSHGSKGRGTEQGLITPSSFGKRGKEQDTGRSNTIFADLIGTNDDDDDLQIKAKLGTFAAGLRTKKYGHDSFELTYKLADSSAFKAKPTPKKRKAEVKTTIEDSFMNSYAISPVPPSNVKGSDNAGKTYTFEWEEDFPFDGDYVFRGQCDNVGKLYINNDPIVDLETWKDGPTPIKKTMTAGVHKIQLDLLNALEYEKIKRIKNLADVTAANTAESNVVTFKISSAAEFANGIKIEGLGIDLSKTYKGPQIRETITKTVEYGRPYNVLLTSSNERSVSGSSGVGIKYTGLKKESNRRFKSGTRLEFDDDSANGFDVNGAFTIDNVQGGSAVFDSSGKSINVKGNNVKVTLTYTWNDIPNYKGKSLDSIRIGTTTWTQQNVRRGSETHTIVLSGKSTGGNVVSGNNDGRIQLRTKGQQVLEMEDARGDDWNDVICSASHGEWFDLNGNKCKFRVPNTDKTVTKYGGGLSGGSQKNGVTYEGPPLASYTQTELGPTISPAYKGQEDFAQNFQDKVWVMTWKGVDFPEAGEYDLQAIADDVCIIKVDGTEVGRAQVHKGVSRSSFTAPKGKHNIELTLNNIPGPATHTFALNPYVTAVKITRKVNVKKVDPRTGTALGKPWTVNPVGVSAVLIPPPCPKIIDGVGIVTDVVVDDPGNGFPPPIIDDPDQPPPRYPVIIELTDIEPDGDPINYDPNDVVCIENTETGEEECFPITTGPFGEITGVSIREGKSYTAYPNIRVTTSTGVGAKFRPRFKIVRDPIQADPDKLIQVTDLVGLKQTGYYDGKPYYGAVFYKDGVRYAGMYETPGILVQIYDTLQESIDAQVTTPPSAIQRQGTDINSNDPRLNIPGTPDNLT